MDYRQCTKCVMDTTDPDIYFTEGGICSHCIEYKKEMERIPKGAEKKDALMKIVNQIKEDGEGKQYDSILGISGGVDSTFLAYKSKELGLRPLAVHMDNGWNSELAVGNIEKTLNKLGIELYTIVLDWEEFKSLQMAFLKASVPDCEIPTDHAIKAVLYQTAKKFKIKHILSGGNIATEAIHPKKWSHGHSDWKYISVINKRFGSQKLKSYPHISYWSWKYLKHIRGIKLHDLLNYLEYKKEDAIKVLENELGWKNYSSKHYESIYTRFFLGYILPKKFNFDERKAHLSTLINSKQIDRETAVVELEESPYPSEELLQEDFEYVLKKFELTKKEFENIMKLPPKSFYDFPSNETSIFVKTFSKTAKTLGFKS